VASINGSARVFDLVSGAWTQVGATLTGTHEFGDAVDISSDGNTIAVSSPNVPGGAGPGSVRVYRLSGGSWAEVGNVLFGVQNGENFGDAISLTANGSRIAISAPSNTEAAPPGQTNGIQFGAVRVFDLSGSTWTQVGSTVFGRPIEGNGNDELGFTLMISDDGTRWAANATSKSMARVYTLTGGAWVQTGATITRPNANTGRSDGLALSRDGKTVAVGFVFGSPKRVSVFSITP
jgi:WD40 repeat protein